MTMASVEELMTVDAAIQVQDMQTWTEISDYLGNVITVDGQPLCDFFGLDFTGMMEANFNSTAAFEMMPMEDVFAFSMIKIDEVPITAMTTVDFSFNEEEIYGWFEGTMGRYEELEATHMAMM